MSKIVEYRAVVSEGDINSLHREVNELIENGYQPLGGISSTVAAGMVVYYAQAMVKHEKPVVKVGGM
jgi:uncharacterized protein YgiM (DUF1202 family)